MTPLAHHLDERHAYVGRAGYGKTNGAKVGVEALLAQQPPARVCIIDPTDAWWGLRLSADGRAPAHPVVIFGGEHGDLPLTEASGETIGLAIARSAQSCVVSLANFIGETARRRFAAGLLAALYEHNREPLHLVVDEADTLAPQKPISPLDNEVLARMQQIVRRGRIRGFVPWLITQRPAVLNKDVLSQADVLVAFNLTSSNDRAAIGAWIEGQADRSEERTMVAQLPRLPRGSALVWAPGAGRLETVAFPLTTTFDSGRTPRRGEKRPATQLAPLDVGALRQQIATVEAEAQQKDPVRLRAEIQRLEQALATAQATRRPSTEELQRAFANGRAAGITVASEVCRTSLQAAWDAMDPTTIEAKLREVVDDTKNDLGDVVHRGPPAQNAKIDRPSTDNSKAVGNGRSPEFFMSAVGGADRALLTVLAQYHPTPVPRERMAAICGYALRGGGFGNRLSGLRRRGWIAEGPSPHAITSEGLAALGPFERLPTGAALRLYWQQRLPKASREILAALAAEGGVASTSSIAERAGYNARGGGFTNGMSKLRTLGLISGSRNVRLHEDLR